MTESEHSKEPHKESLVDFVTASIRDGIKEGRFAPGQRLIEADLTAELAISRGPLREAMRRLAGEGLVVIEPHRGAVVRKLNPEDVRELYQVRESLEGLAARLAAEHINEGDNRERLLQAVAEMQKYRKSDDILGYMAANIAFHDLIVDISNNRYLSELTKQLRLPVFRHQLNRLMSASAKRQSINGHQTLAKAILDGDPVKAERAMRRHVHQSANFVEAIAETYNT